MDAEPDAALDAVLDDVLEDGSPSYKRTCACGCGSCTCGYVLLSQYNQELLGGSDRSVDDALDVVALDVAQDVLHALVVLHMDGTEVM